MKKLLIKLLGKLLETHKYPRGVLVHRKNGTVVFETEFTWYDEKLEPVTVVREVKSGKIFSISALEMKDFVEYTGKDPNGGSDL